MTALVILAVWIAVVLGIGAAITRPWRTEPPWAPLPLVLGLAAGGWVLITGYIAFSQMMDDGAWTGASIAMGYVPAKAIVLLLLATYAGRTFLAARARGAKDIKAWALPVLLAAATVYIVEGDVTRMRITALEQHARDPALTSVEVAALTQKIRSGAAERSEAYAFLSNPLCPPDLLTEFVAHSDPYWRMAVASNDTLAADIALKLTEDPDDQVRFYLAFNRKLPPEILTRLAADKSDRVRDIVAWTDGLPDEAFERLVNDPSAKVRATAALQRRISEAQLEKLRNDPEQSVRDAANRWTK